MGSKEISLGEQGEKLAVKHLKKKGYAIRARNFRTRLGEVDIIAADGDYVVFVEVKTRSSTRFGMPFEAVTVAKQKQLSKVALEYLAQHNLTESPARFDVVSILISDGAKPAIELIKNAFELNFGI